MKIPKIHDHLITDIYGKSKDIDLLQLFLESTADEQEKSLVGLLLYATDDQAKAQEILLRCFYENKNLQTFYPAIDSTEPHGELIGTILDGSLWLI